MRTILRRVWSVNCLVADDVGTCHSPVRPEIVSPSFSIKHNELHYARWLGLRRDKTRALSYESDCVAEPDAS